MQIRTAIIIGAGPAGLTAALELLERSDIKPIILEKDDCVGGIARTVNYNGYRMDIGGHRFFTKAPEIMSWWKNVLPDDFLAKNRYSHIYYLKKFFPYPIALNLTTLGNLGFKKIFKIGFDYLKASLFRIKPERTLEDFYVNRFGRELYNTFFRDYTQKVWGVPCSSIGADWGAQRVKGLSIARAVAHAMKISRRKETSLIDAFYYPKYGPGQLWQAAAEKIRGKGGEIILNHEAVKIELKNNRIVSVTARNSQQGTDRIIPADYVISSMPIKDLIARLDGTIPPETKEIAAHLPYRDFIAVGMLLARSRVQTRDQWIYIQEPDVKMGRLQIFNNWSEGLLADKNKIWFGLEYFANVHDELWRMSDEEIIALAKQELKTLDFADPSDVMDATVVKMEKAYPAYWGSYERLPELRNFTDKIENLYLVGRNGLHRYNNMDHSMMTAMVAVKNIIEGKIKKDNIWGINMEKDYHENKRQ